MEFSPLTVPPTESKWSPKRFMQLWCVLFSVLATAVFFGLMWKLTKTFDTSTAEGLSQKLLCCGGLSALLGSLFYILMTAVLLPRRTTADHPDWFYPLMAGILSFCTMFVAYSFLGMWPFGERTGMTVDMHHQYAPLLAGLKDNILTGDLGTYSFEVGLGINYVSLFAYYLASPFNLLLLVFPDRLLAEGILFITLLKNALSGALFALCVQKIYKHKSLCVPMIAVMYSLMMYLLAYSWNVMWLDVAMMLPLVIWGFERLMNEGKYLTYIVSLAYCMFANYYIAFMLCIFLVLYYIAYVVREPRNGLTTVKGFGKFAGSSLLAAGLAAVILVPVYFALKTTSAANDILPEETTNTLNFFELLGRHLAGTSPTIRARNLPNLYCGVLTAICVPLFALNKGISTRRRATYMGLWLVLACSFLINKTDLAWHGFHSPNDLPYRFSFLYSFFILLMAFEALIHLKHLEAKHVFGVVACAIAYLFIEEQFGSDAYGFKQIYINLVLFAVYGLILALATKKKVRQGVAYALLLLTVVAEMTVNAGATFITINKNEYFTKHDDYVDNDVTATIQAAIDRLHTLGDQAADGDFYRVEFLPRRTCVDTALFHYRGVTSFSSSNYYATTKAMGGLGYAINGVNSHLYRSFVPFTDSLFGIRYVALTANIPNHQQLKQLERVAVNDTEYYIYENTDALGLGYVAKGDLLSYSHTQYDPFGSQNDLFTALTGLYDDLYTLCDVTSSDEGGMAYQGSGFRMFADENSGYATFTATVEEDGQLFLYADCSAADSLTVHCGNQSWNVTPYEPYIVDGGKVTAGTEVALTVNSDIDCFGNFYVAVLNNDVYEQGMATLKTNSMTLSTFNNNHIAASVNSGYDGALMTSIPYDTGWKVTVDGKAVDTYCGADGFLTFDVTAGEHAIQFEYTPEGWTLGLIVSLGSLLIVLLLCGFSYWKHRKAAVSLKQSTMETVTVDPVEVMPVQREFSVETKPMDTELVIPDTLEELTGQTPSQNGEGQEPTEQE